MIKVIAFDLVGVLVRENDFELTPECEKLERMFGPNINDTDFIMEARKIIPNDALLMRTIEYILNNIYDVRERNLFKQIKAKYPNVKIAITTNHVSYIRNFIGEAFGLDYLDDVLISAEIHKIKPNADFYEHILNRFKISPNELLFLDDNIENVDGAIKLGINSFKIDKDTNIYNKIISFLETTNN